MATMPVVPPAPALFSIRNCWPSRCDIRSANMRASTSVLPPAANGTTTVTGFVGQPSCAQALCAHAAVAQLDATTPTSSATAMRFILGSSVDGCATVLIESTPRYFADDSKYRRSGGG